MSESDTMFNEQDRRCAVVQVMLSPDPSYDNRTIARTIAGLPRITGTCPGWWKQSFRLRLWSLVWFHTRVTSCHLTKPTPKCTWMCWRVWWFLVQTGGRWQILGGVAGLGADPQVQRDLGLASEGVLRLCTHLSLPPPPTWTRWTTSFGHTSRTSSTWPPITPIPARSPSSAEYSLSSRRAPADACGKGMSPSFGSVSRRWLRLKATTLNRCQIYYIIKLPELIFFNKSFKINL